MRAELPWNVAGIPPEAREAARAAARREGLSVGEWLTRRILRSFSGLEEDSMPLERAQFSPSLDSWGMPQSAASRRETEDMLARVGRSESESSEVYRRVEEQLRNVGRRLDSSERSHSESNRVISRTAQEMNIAAREQAQAFDQMGLNVMALNERLARVERSAAGDGIKEAVKGLHQGLSRLADQITQTANQSAAQVSQLTGGLEQLASRLGQARVDAEEADKILAQRIVAVENVGHNNDSQLQDRVVALEHGAETGMLRLEQRLGGFQSGIQANNDAVAHRLQGLENGVHATTEALEQRIAGVQTGAQTTVEALEQRFAASANVLEQRLAAAEKTAQFHTNAIDHALEKIEAASAQRSGDQGESQRRLGQFEDSLHRLEDAMARLENRGAADPHTEQRLNGIEHGLSGIVQRLEHYDPAAPLQDTLQHLTQRIETLEKDHNALLAELKANMAPPQEPPPFRGQDSISRPGDAFAAEPPGAFEAPPFVEHQAPGFGYGAQANAFQPDAFADPATLESFHDNSADPYVPEHGAPPPRTDAFEPASDYSDLFAAPSEEPENFLAQARRNARAAAEKSDSDRKPRMGGFNWGAPAAAEKAPGEKPRYLIPAAVAMIVVLAIVAGLVLSQRVRPSVAPLPTASNAPAGVKSPVSLPKPPGDEAQYVVAPPASPSQKPSTPRPSAPQKLPVPQAQQAPLQQRTVRSAPVQPVPDSAPAPAKTAPAGRVAQLANANNPVAETIMGLRALDGTDGAAVNLPDALKWLTAAANQGQAVAQYRLGTMYERGQGMPADGAKAAHWYEMAANQGNRKAMHNLAVADASGAAGKKNMAEAARWFAKAAGLGLSDSQFNLAVLYERGDGVPQSLLDAFKWYSIAAAQGDTESKARIAVLQTQLSDSDRAAAQKSAATFHAAPLNRSANVPPEPTDLG